MYITCVLTYYASELELIYSFLSFAPNLKHFFWSTFYLYSNSLQFLSVFFGASLSTPLFAPKLKHFFWSNLFFFSHSLQFPHIFVGAAPHPSPFAPIFSQINIRVMHHPQKNDMISQAQSRKGGKMRQSKFTFQAFLIIVLIFSVMAFFFTLFLSGMADKAWNPHVNDSYEIAGTNLTIRYSDKKATASLKVIR